MNTNNIIPTADQWLDLLEKSAINKTHIIKTENNNYEIKKNLE